MHTGKSEPCETTGQERRCACCIVYDWQSASLVGKKCMVPGLSTSRRLSVRYHELMRHSVQLRRWTRLRLF